MHTTSAVVAAPRPRSDVPPTPDEDAFEEFVLETADSLLRTAVLLHGGDRFRAEDLLQATLVKVYSRWDLVVGADSPVAYVRTMLLRTFLADRRRRRVRESALDDARHVAAPGPDVATRLTVVEALATLPPKDRAVLVLRYYEDLSFAETAARLGASETACRTRASRALRRLRAHLPDLDPELAHDDLSDPSRPDGTDR